MDKSGKFSILGIFYGYCTHHSINIYFTTRCFYSFFLYYWSYYLVNPWGINISFGDRNEWDGKDSGAEAGETETIMGEACSLKATAGKTTISIIRATTDCGREQGCPDSSTDLHQATSSNEHYGVTPGTVRNNWDHSEGSTLMVKMAWYAREGFHYCFINWYWSLSKQTVEWALGERTRPVIRHPGFKSLVWHQLAQWFWANLCKYLSLIFSHLGHRYLSHLPYKVIVNT